MYKGQEVKGETLDYVLCFSPLLECSTGFLSVLIIINNNEINKNVIKNERKKYLFAYVLTYIKGL